MVKKLQLSKLKSSSAGEVVVVDPLVVFHQAVENAKPLLGTSSVKKGGKIYLVSLHNKHQSSISVSVATYHYATTCRSPIPCLQVVVSFSLLNG